MDNTLLYDDAYGISERAASRKRRRAHHRHIVNRVRFTAFMIVVILMAGMLTGLMFGSFDAEGSSKTIYKTITVSYGDTLWDIASRYKPEDKEIRNYIYEICDYNDISAGGIYEGQELTIPVSE